MTNRQAHIIVAAENVAECVMLAEILLADGHRVQTASSTDAAMHLITATRPDLLVLDRGLFDPIKTGLTSPGLAASPVLLLCQTKSCMDRSAQLRSGLDDFILRPLKAEEVRARAAALLKKAPLANGAPRSHLLQASATRSSDRVVRFGGCLCYIDRRELIDPDGNPVALTSGDFELLTFLLERPNQIITRDQITLARTGTPWSPFDRSIDTQIRRLRQKLASLPGGKNLIKTVRGSGYLFSPPAPETL